MFKKRIHNNKKNIITKKDILFNLILIITFLIIYTVLTRNNHLFASQIDFKYQHYLIPEYFRTLFYDTHDLFPDFALNLGGGQNIYYLSYYGLLNPFILLSYLFPKIKMIYFMITTNCFIVLISTSLFYFYLRKNKYNEKTSFITAFLFLTSGPLIFHAKRHIMFINYFPFLILGLFGIDSYFEKKKITLLTISIALIIFTSYYFSIPSLIVLFLYSIYKYLKTNKQISLKIIINHSLKISIPFILGIMISACLTIPTLYVLINGRTSSTTNISIKKLLTPSLTTSLFYDPYTIGLTLISLISLIYFAIHEKKETKYLSITCLLIATFPIFNYILNGTLYINAKSLIPFIPIILILVAEFLSPYLNKKTNKKQILLIIYLITSSFSICLYTNLNDNLMKKEDINNLEYNTINEFINEITKEDTSFYRINTEALKEQGINKITNIKEYKTTIYSSTSNQNYMSTYNNILKNPLPNRNKFMIAPSTNLLSQMILNEKYIITKDTLGIDLELIKEKNGIKLYKNNQVLPLGYATNQVISNKQFKKISYPNNIITLLNNIILKDDNLKEKELPILTNQNLDYEIVETNNIEITTNKDTKIIKANKNASMKIKLKQNTNNKIIFLQFHHAYTPNKDLTITINNTQNKLTAKSWKYFNNNTTFTYVLYDADTLNIVFEEGTYKLNNFESYTIDYNKIKNLTDNIDQMQIDTSKTKGDTIIGKINVTKNNSYFTISIPYDKGFKILVDNKNISYQKSGTNFITFPISKGNHNIKITYEAPYKKTSLFISTLGIIALIVLKIFSKSKNTSLKK